MININDYIKPTKEEIDWFDKNMFEIKSQNRPDLERGMLLYYLCKRYKAKKCLDIGTAGFFSAKSMAYSGARVDTIDIKGESVNYENINFIKGDSGDIVPVLGEYDVCFVDGDHSYMGVKEDLQNCKKRCKIIVAHDYGNLPEVTRAIDEELPSFEFILEDRMWKGAPYENGVDKHGQKIDYGVAVAFKGKDYE